MELNLHPIATKCFVSSRAFAENDRVVCYLAREANGEVIRRDLLEAEDGRFMPPAFIYCRWVVGFKQRKAGENPARTLKLTAENLFLTLALPVNVPEDTVLGTNTGFAEANHGALPVNVPEDTVLGTNTGFAEANHGAISATNTPLLQFLALMLERKRLLKPRGVTADGQRQIYEHMPSHQLYEIPVGDLNVEFFQKIQEHLGVLVGAPKPKLEPAAVVATAAT